MNAETENKNGRNEEITVSLLAPGEHENELAQLICAFCREIGETPPDGGGLNRLGAARREGKIQFFAAFCGQRMVGMCSVSEYFSTFSCGGVGVFDDFYIEPGFRKKGIARLLAACAQAWARGCGMASLSVTSSECDEAMYRALGFTLELGRTFAAV